MIRRAVLAVNWRKAAWAILGTWAQSIAFKHARAAIAVVQKMIVLDCEQGSQAWIDARLGIPTASEFSRIVTPTGRASTAAEGYTAELLAEWALGYPIKEFGGDEWTERGKELEPDARAFYALDTNLDPQTVGFVYRDERKMVGGSPDALVGERACWN